MRSLTDPLILSTLPHSLAALYPVPLPYRATILLSTFLSVVWHLQGEPSGWLKTFDYSLAGWWVALEFWYALQKLIDTSSCPDVLFPSLAVLFFNSMADDFAAQGYVSYEVAHSLWHLLSAAKSIWIARQLAPSGGQPVPLAPSSFAPSSFAPSSHIV